MKAGRTRTRFAQTFVLLIDFHPFAFAFGKWVLKPDNRDSVGTWLHSDTMSRKHCREIPETGRLLNAELFIKDTEWWRRGCPPPGERHFSSFLSPFGQ
jgi:hypothetical protein